MKDTKTEIEKHYYTNRSVCDLVVDELNALEQAIGDICDIDTVHAIQDRKKVILKR